MAEAFSVSINADRLCRARFVRNKKKRYFLYTSARRTCKTSAGYVRDFFTAAQTARTVRGVCARADSFPTLLL